jgi:two-component system nitrate/nitrite response regulator NarL
VLDVLLIGSDPLARGGLTAALAPYGDVVVVGQADPDDALEPLISSLEPDALLWDGVSDPTEIATLALVNDSEAASEALRRGAHGVLLRDGDGERMAAALHAIARDIRLVDGAFAQTLLPEARIVEPLEEPLTPRELQVLDLLAQGLSNRLIAGRLEISEHTAKFHVNAILYKLSARSRTDAVVRAVKGGYLTL